MEFQEKLDRVGLMDMPLVGGQWTWSNLQRPPSWSRIDHFLLSPTLLLKLAGACQNLLPRLTLDHFPICLEVEGIQWGSVPFRCDNKWLGIDRFRQLVEEVWNNSVVQGKANYKIATKLKSLKEAIKTWSKEEKIKK